MKYEDIDFRPLRDASITRSILAALYLSFFTPRIIITLILLTGIASAAIFPSTPTYVVALLALLFMSFNFAGYMGGIWDDSWKKFCKQNDFEIAEVSDKQSYIPPSLFMKSSDESAVQRDITQHAIVDKNRTWEVYQYLYGKLSAFSSNANRSANLDIKEYFSWRNRGDQFFTIARCIVSSSLEATKLQDAIILSGADVSVEYDHNYVFVISKGRITKKSMQNVFTALTKL